MFTRAQPVTLSTASSRKAMKLILGTVGIGILAGLTAWRTPLHIPEIEAMSRHELASAIARAPADRLLYDRAAELALDLPDEGRHELWLGAHAMTRRLAPDWPAAQSGFIRGAFFHWPVLSDADRALVANEAGIMLTTPELFGQYWRTIWLATGDLDLFLRVAPPDAETGVVLSSLASASGRFDEYRSLRDGLGDRRTNDLANAPPPSSDTVLQHLVAIARVPAMRPLMRADLRYLERNRPEGKTIDAGSIQAFVEYAIENRLSPLGGLFEIGFSTTLLDPTLRARLAVALNNTDLADRIERSEIAAGNASILTPYRVERALFELTRNNLLEAQAQMSRIPEADAERDDVLEARAEVARAAGRAVERERAERLLLERFAPDTLGARWEGTCQRQLCRAVASVRLFAPGEIDIDLPVRTVETDRVGSYLEVALDGRIVDEGVVTDQRTFRVEVASRGLHSIEIRVINPIARRWGPRRIVELLEPAVSLVAKDPTESASNPASPGPNERAPG